MISHHPSDELLLAHAGGHDAGGPALLLDVHLEACVRCRSRMRLFDAMGGALLEAAQPVPLAATALASTLARIDAGAAAPAAVVEPTLPSLPAPLRWPTPLRRCEISRWRWIAPGMRFARVTLPQDRTARLFLLRIGAGRSLARHTHGGQELTQVLCGSFDDGRALFGAGDFDAADADVHHQPVVRAGAECICLASVSAPLRFDNVLARALGRLIGM